MLIVGVVLVRIPIVGVPIIVLAVFLMIGFLVLKPNESAVLTLFGRYVGTVRRDGFHWVNPFFAKQKIIAARPQLHDADAEGERQGRQPDRRRRRRRSG